MLEVGKTYRDSRDDSEDICILTKLPVDDNYPKYQNYTVHFVNRFTKATEPGEYSIHEDSISALQEVKGMSNVKD